MDIEQQKRFTAVICEHSDTKKCCGQILKIFTQHLLETDAACFIWDIISRDFFLDLNGSVDKFYSHFPTSLSEAIKFRLTEKRESPDSDEDEQGNLR